MPSAASLRPRPAPLLGRFAEPKLKPPVASRFYPAPSDKPPAASLQRSHPAPPLGLFAKPKLPGSRPRCQSCASLKCRCSVLEEEIAALEQTNGLLSSELHPLAERLAEVEARPGGIPLRSLDPRHGALGEPPSDSDWDLFDALVAVTVGHAKGDGAGRVDTNAGAPPASIPANVTAPVIAALLYGQGHAAAACPAGSLSRQLEELRTHRAEAALRDLEKRVGPVCAEDFELKVAELETRLNPRQKAALIQRLGGGDRWRRLEEERGALAALSAALAREADALRAQLGAARLHRGGSR